MAKLQEYYKYGGPKFIGYYYKEELGRFKLALLCLRRAFMYTGEVLGHYAVDIFCICKPSHPSEPLYKKIMLSVTFLVSLAGVLSVPGLMLGFYLGLTLLIQCAFCILATIAALALIIFVYKFVKSCIKYMRKNSEAVREIVVKACNHDGKVFFHQRCDTCRTTFSAHQIKRPPKNINVDWDYIPRSLVISPLDHEHIK